MEVPFLTNNSIEKIRKLCKDNNILMSNGFDTQKNVYFARLLQSDFLKIKDAVLQVLKEEKQDLSLQRHNINKQNNNQNFE